jgi:hypothetical protein
MRRPVSLGSFTFSFVMRPSLLGSIALPLASTVALSTMLPMPIEMGMPAEKLAGSKPAGSVTSPLNDTWSVAPPDSASLAASFFEVMTADDGGGSAPVTPVS